MKIKTKLSKEYIKATGKCSISIGGVIHTNEATVHNVSEENARTIRDKYLTVTSFDAETSTTKLHTIKVLDIIETKKKVSKPKITTALKTEII